MEESYNNQKLLALRKLTRAVADLLRGQMRDYLSTLAPLLRPRAVFGDYVESSTKETARGAEAAFKELQGLYGSVASSSPFKLTTDLKPPFEIISTALEMTPMEYTHVAKTEHESKTVSITSPLKWVLTYSGFAPGRLREFLADQNQNSEVLSQFVLHYLVMHMVMSKQTGVTQILDALHLKVSLHNAPEFGGLPLTIISSSISTIRPPDHVIIENTEISGRNAFEEIVNVEDIVRMSNPLKEQLMEIVKSHGEGPPAR